jgi:CheY-like chemotaxis protein
MENNVKHKTVMIIDDNKIDAILNKKIIEKSLFSDNILVENSPILALNYLTSGKELPSIIFVDMMMPEMNGFQFLEAFDKLNEDIQKSTKIIFMSSSVLSNEQMNVVNASKNIIKFTIKPLSTSALESIKALTV